MEFKIIDYDGVVYIEYNTVPTVDITLTAKASGVASYYTVGSTLYELAQPLKVVRGQSYVFNEQQKMLSNVAASDSNVSKKTCLNHAGYSSNHLAVASKLDNVNNLLQKKCFSQKGITRNHSKKCFKFDLKYNNVSKKMCFGTKGFSDSKYSKKCVNIKSIEFKTKKQCVSYSNDFETVSLRKCFDIKSFLRVNKKKCVSYSNEFESASLRKCFDLPTFTRARIKRCSNIDTFERQSSNFVIEVLDALEQNADLEFLCLYEGARDTYELDFVDRLCRLPKFKYEPKVEFIMNSFKIIDLESGEELNALACDLSYSQDSLTWDVGIELAYNTNPLYYTVGRRLRIEINGFAWTIRVSSSSVSKQFAKTSISCSAESVNYYERSTSVPLPTEGHPSAVGDINLAYYADDVAEWQVQISGNESLQAINKAIADSLGGVLLTNTDTGEQYVKPLTNYPVGTYRKISDNLVITHSAEYAPYEPANVALLTSNKKLYAAKKRDTNQNVTISSNLPDFATKTNIVRKYAERVLAETDKHSVNQYTLPLNDATGLLLPTECVVVMNRYVVVNSLSISVKWESGLVVRQSIEATEYQIKGFKHNG